MEPYKIVLLIGLILSIVGSILTGLIAKGGIPKRGDIIKADQMQCAAIGWIFMIAGFVMQAVAIFL